MVLKISLSSKNKPNLKIYPKAKILKIISVTFIITKIRSIFINHGYV